MWNSEALNATLYLGNALISNGFPFHMQQPMSFRTGASINPFTS